MNRVVFLDETSRIAGAERNLLLQTAALQRIEGWDVAVFLPEAGPLAESLTDQGIPIFFVTRGPLMPSSFYLLNRFKLPNPLALLFNLPSAANWAMKLRLAFKIWSADVVHTVSMWAHICGGLAGRMAGRPVVWHVQDIVDSRSGLGLYRRLFLAAARAFPHRIIVVSAKTAEQFHAHPASRDKIVVLDNVVDLSMYPFRTHRSPDGRLILGTAARLTPWKGHDLILQTARLLKERGLRFEWHIAGDDSLGAPPGYRAHLLAQSRALGLDDCLCYLGWVADMPAFYHSLDFLIHLPLEPDPSPLALAEALASGLPIILASGGGADAMISEAGGWLVPPNQPDAVAALVEQIAAGPHELAERGRRARSYAEAHFNPDAYARRLVEIYSALI